MGPQDWQLLLAETNCRLTDKIIDRTGIVEEGARRRAAHPQHVYIPPYDRIPRPPQPARPAPPMRAAAPNRATAVMIQFCEAYTAASGELYTLPHLRGEKRNRGNAAPRHVCMLLVRNICRISTPRIGKLFGSRDHTTVLKALRRAPEWLAADPALKRAHDAVVAHFARHGAAL